ncbi:MAG: F0F1 ATP synthase subunit B [Oscillospiraceae bacterium]|nr:F0F1 ATP synthase subunit B [Oscillospiraceae bacterium]
MLKLDWNIIWTVVNLLILFFFLKKFLFKKVLNIMEQRRSMVEASFAEADNAKKQAEEIKEQYEENLKNADKEAASIIASAKERAAELHDKSVEQTRHETDKMIEEANRVISLEHEKALRNSKQEIACLAVAVASKIIADKADFADDAHELDAFIAEAGAEK